LSDLHIASCIARVHSHGLAQARTAINEIERCQVLASDEQSKLVVVVEGSSTGNLLDTIDLVRAVKHVMSVDLVYQHAESEIMMKETMPCL
jgi:nitrate reductase NapAB chaperone NapD